MTEPAIRLQALPAAHGDCLLVECPLPRRTWRLLVDAGPDESYPALRSRLQRIPPDSRGRRCIDLFIVSHIDHDHIGGVARLLADRDLKLQFGDLWFNAPKRIGTRGVQEGQALADRLGLNAAGIAWNLALGGTASTPSGSVREVGFGRGGPVLTLLTPSPQRLQSLFRVWERELARFGEQVVAPAARVGTRAAFLPDLQALAATRTSNDRSVSNGSAIAVLLEHRGASVLLAADAFAPDLALSLKTLATQRGLPLPMSLDAIKLSHHGSQGNITAALFKVVQAQHHVISTNGAIFGHPDDVAIARTILLGGPRPTLWFNHANARNRRWDSQPLKERHGYAVRWPQGAAEGVVLDLPQQA